MKRHIFWLMSLMMGFTSCFHTIRAPQNTVPRRIDFDQDPFGGYIKITSKDSTRYEGELIGSRNDSVMVLKSKSISLAKSDIVRAMVIMYNPGQYGFGYLGILATPLINGYFLGITAPLWIISTTSAVAEEDTPNYKSFPAKPVMVKKAPPTLISESEAWKELLKYSRFPGGVPDNIRLTDLKGRQK